MKNKEISGWIIREFETGVSYSKNETMVQLSSFEHLQKSRKNSFEDKIIKKWRVVVWTRDNIRETYIESSELLGIDRLIRIIERKERIMKR